MPGTAPTATPNATEAVKPEDKPITVVLKEAGDDFAPRLRKSTADALSALKPSLDAVQGQPDKVYTIAEDLTPNKAASLVSLLNERYDNRWTFGGRSTDDGQAIVQARYSEKPENARPERKPRAATNGAGKPQAKPGLPEGKRSVSK